MTSLGCIEMVFVALVGVGVSKLVKFSLFPAFVTVNHHNIFNEGRSLHMVAKLWKMIILICLLSTAVIL